MFVLTVNFVRKICKRAHSDMSSHMRAIFSTYRQLHGAARIRYRVYVGDCVRKHVYAYAWCVHLCVDVCACGCACAGAEFYTCVF